MEVSCEYILNKQSWTADQEWPSSLGVWGEAKTSHCENYLRLETSHRASELDLESPCECGIEPPASVSHGVS